MGNVVCGATATPALTLVGCPQASSLYSTGKATSRRHSILSRTGETPGAEAVGPSAGLLTTEALRDRDEVMKQLQKEHDAMDGKMRHSPTPSTRSTPSTPSTPAASYHSLTPNYN